MNSEERGPSQALGLWVVLVVTVLAWAPTTFPGYWQSIEGFSPVFNARYPAAIANIATVPDLWRGSGTAAFILARPLIAMGISSLAAVRIVFALTLLIGSLGIYAWLRSRFGDQGAGLAALSYALMPPFLTTVYVRGDLANAVVLALLPLVLAGTAHYRLSRNPATIGLSVVGLIWIWRTQAGLALFASIIVFLYALIVERDRLAGLAILVAAVAGGLSLIQERAITGPPPVPFFDNFLGLGELLWVAGPNLQPFQLGYVAIGATITVLWLLWMRRRTPSGDDNGRQDDLLAPALLLDQERFIVAGVALVAIAAVCSFPIATPLWRLSGLHRLLAYPWQLLLLTYPFMAAIVGALPVLAPGLARRSYWAGLLGLVVLAALPHLTPRFIQYQPPEQPVAVYGADARLVLLEATLESASTDSGGSAELSVAWQPLETLDFDYNIFFQALRQADEGEYEVVAQLDQQPLAGRAGAEPATAWQPGEVFTSTYVLDLPVDPDSEPLRYYFGFYNWEDNTRIPLQGGDDRVILYAE